MCLFKTLVKMEKKISGQYFYVNMYVFISDHCNVALTYQEQLFTHANAQETPQIRSVSHFPSQPGAETSTPRLVLWVFIPGSPRLLLLLSELIHRGPGTVSFSSARMGFGVAKQ